MHKAQLIRQNPKKSLKEIASVVGNMLWHNYFAYKLTSPKKDKASNLELQKLHLQAQKLLGEIEILDGELKSIPYIKGFIFNKKKKSQSDPNKIYEYKILRWSKDGVTEDKHLVKKKRKESDLTFEEAEVLLENYKRAQSIGKEIELRKSRVKKLENKIIVLTGQNTSLKHAVKVVSSHNIIGREEELIKLQSNLLSRIHTLIVGEPGIGKSLLLRTLIETTDCKHIFIDNLRATKNTLVDTVIKKLHEDNELNIEDEKLSSVTDFEDVKKFFKGKPVSEIADVIRDSLINKDYFIAIDSLASLSQANKTVIEKLFEAHIPIFACTNQLKSSVEFESLYRKFSKLELKPLENKRIEEILNQKLQNIKADNWIGLLKSRIANAACGNPGIIDKMVKDAYALSIGGELTENQIRAIQLPDLHRRYFDLTPLLIASIACFAILRFIGIGTNDTLLYVVGGSAFVILLAMSRLMNRGFRK